jgi:hypothetical protein
LEKRNIHIDEQLKGIFESFEPSVPFQFEALERKLDQRKGVRRNVLWSSVAAVVFTAVSGIYFLAPDTAKVNSLSKQTTEAAISTENTTLVSKKEISKPSKNNTKESQYVADFNANPRKSQNEALPLKDKASNSFQNNMESREQNYSLAALPKINIQKHLPNTTIGYPTTAFRGHVSDIAISENNGMTYATQEYHKDFSNVVGKTLQYMPNSLGNLLQLPDRIHLPQMPKQPLSSWAFEVGYDQNQTALAYQISPGREKYVHKNYLNRVKQGEIALNAPQLQASIKYEFNKRWSVLLGLGFSQTRVLQNFDFRDSVPFSIAQGNTSDALGNFPIFGYLDLGQRVQYEGTHVMQMLSIPMGLSYRIPLNRFWSFNTEVSARYNRLFMASGKTLNYHDLSLQQVNEEIFRSDIWSARFSAGADYRLNTHQYLGLRWNTQGALTPFYIPDAAVSNRAWSTGLSVFYTFKLF